MVSILWNGMVESRGWGCNVSGLLFSGMVLWNCM